MSAGWEIRVGGALKRLRELPADSVQCCVTSPPYFGLRDYDTGEWDGGDPACDHVKSEIRTGKGLAAWSAIHARGGAHKASEVDEIHFRQVCGHCGARRIDEQIGLEPTVEEYVERLVAVFGEVRRVLRADGTVWLNIGDSYANSPPGTKRPGASESSTLHGVMSERYRATLDAGAGTKRDTSHVPGVKPKDLLMVPAQLALALRSDGWWLRSEVVWAKPNPMPESVTDRPTSAHEKLFLLTKSARYYYDADAIREESPEYEQRRTDIRDASEGDQLRPKQGYAGKRNGEAHGLGRNKRNVWEIATTPYPGAHFATFPPKLVEPCVLAGSRPGDVILDPFAGSGTTGMVALRHDRGFVGVELNAQYAELARNRIRDDAPLLNTVAELAAC